MNQNQIFNILKKMSGNNPILNNAMNMIQNGDNQGVEQLARNLCKSKGINPDEAFNNIKQQYSSK